MNTRRLVQGPTTAADNHRAMTRPRPIVPKTLCFVTARAVGRMFRFVPQRDVVRVFEYLFAVAAERFGMKVHEALCMSNHFHVLMSDVDGQLPDFMHYFDSLLARSLNAMRGTSGSVFEKGYSLVVVTDDAKALEHAVYTLANPCAAHLVRRSKQWPGFSTLRMKYGETRKIERPKLGLWTQAQTQIERGRKRPRNSERDQHRGKPSRLPDVVDLTLERPPIYIELSDAELRTELRQQLDAEELALIKKRGHEDREVLGVSKVLAQPWYGFPGRPADMFGTNPTVSGRTKWVRIEALQRRREFELAYARARASFLAGIREVLWPFGTWLMRVRFGLPVETSLC
jgi:putative transposase